ncbi:hypothetical protein HOY82DRAFT_618761 [Tuber indicum]|nr:hypothetical protein HOY82DRAFT_618761 [Tuber indicum]
MPIAYTYPYTSTPLLGGIASGNTTSFIAYATPVCACFSAFRGFYRRRVAGKIVKFFSAIVGRFGRVPHATQGKSHLVWNAKEHGSVPNLRDFLRKYSKIDSTNSHNYARLMDIDGDTSSSFEASCWNFGGKVTGSVITVATNLLDTEKKALVAAAKARELETLQITHEPVVAVLATSEDIRQIVVEKVERQVNVHKVIVEAAIKGTQKSRKVEVTINIG